MAVEVPLSWGMQAQAQPCLHCTAAHRCMTPPRPARRRQRGLHCPLGGPGAGTPTCVACPVPYPPDLVFECNSTMEERWNLTLPPQFVKPPVNGG